jgi:CTD kinase subunit beta
VAARPVKTFDTACTYYHKFRLCFRDAEYSYQDAAMASLFVACKVEDTIKKSKEILCAAYNLKNPDKPTTADDKVLEQPHRIIIGLERLVLETIGFDFRVRYPQKLLAKVVRRLGLGGADAARFWATAYDMSIDMYKTFAPIKQTTFTMALTIVELTSLLTGLAGDQVRGSSSSSSRSGSNGSGTSLVDAPHKWHTRRACVVETMLDLLDLYSQNAKSTKVGPRFDPARFLEIKIRTNNEVDGSRRLARHHPWCERCAATDGEAVPTPAQPITPGSATSPATTGSGGAGSNGNGGGGGVSSRRAGGGKEGTMRFVFDVEEARVEQEEVGRYFNEEMEEYEVEVEEAVPESSRGDGRHGHGYGHGHGHGHGGRVDKGPHGHRNGGHANAHEGGWAPYQRSRHGHHDRPKARKGGGFY